MSHLLISAAHKSSGKTILCIGLSAEFRRRGIRLQPFKKGPDYIDPLWLSQAAGRSCQNLDFYTQSRKEILASFHHHMGVADLGLIEGNKGLYDGLDLDGSNSNAALGSLLQVPVILVLDTQGMTRGIAPLLLGYQAFDRNIRIAGVILNKVGGKRHEEKLRRVIDHYTNIPLVGAVHGQPELQIVERHLGLIPSNEAGEADRQIEMIREAVARQVDIDRLLRIAESAQMPAQASGDFPQSAAHGQGLRIGIARDQAFGFYYPGDLEAFERLGAQLVPFSPIQDRQLPDVDGIFIGGGFPETQMRQLQANNAMRQAINTYVEQGGHLYAECGGLMYLSRSVSWKGERCAMVGLVPGDALMHERPQGRGYVQMLETPAHPWRRRDAVGQQISAHEFHYSSLENLPAGLAYAFEVKRGMGIDGRHDGIVYKNMLASYTHLRDVEAYPWVSKFLSQVYKAKSAPALALTGTALR